MLNCPNYINILYSFAVSNFWDVKEKSHQSENIIGGKILKAIKDPQWLDIF